MKCSDSICCTLSNFNLKVAHPFINPIAQNLVKPDVPEPEIDGLWDKEAFKTEASGAGVFVGAIWACTYAFFFKTGHGAGHVYGRGDE
jgi:hypothetical protein